VSKKIERGALGARGRASDQANQLVESLIHPSDTEMQRLEEDSTYGQNELGSASGNL
jgi:hypothetical protein